MTRPTTPDRLAAFGRLFCVRDLSAALKLVVEVSSRLKTVVSSGWLVVGGRKLLPLLKTVVCSCWFAFTKILVNVVIRSDSRF